LIPSVDFGAPLPLNKVFIAGETTRPAFDIATFFIVLACADVEIEFPNIRIEIVSKAKAFGDFEGNILGRFSQSIFPLCRGDVIKRMRAIKFQYKEFDESSLLSPHICMDTRLTFTVQIQPNSLFSSA
jgi:hypothetical protein